MIRFNHNLLPNTPPRSCAIDIWTNDENNIININDNAKIQTRCITGYDSCSFRYSQIDDQYTINNDILNKDYMENLIDNDGRYFQIALIDSYSKHGNIVDAYNVY